MSTPEGWPQIHQEAQGFNLALGIFLCSLAHELHGGHPGWGRRVQMLVRAALAERPDMAAWPIDEVKREFYVETLVARWRSTGPAPCRHLPMPISGLASYFLAIPSGVGGAPWWAGETLPDILREQHGLFLLTIKKGSPLAAGPWRGAWGAFECVRDTFDAFPDARPQKYGRDGRSFERELGLHERGLLSRCLADFNLESSPPSRL